MFSFVLIAWLQSAVGMISNVQRQSILNATILSNNDASISYNEQTTSISDDGAFNVIVSTQDDYDIRLSLSDEWAFIPSTTSTLSLTLQGHTPFPGADSDLMLVFSVNDWQYFSFFIHLDYTNKLKSRIYPSLSMQSILSPVTQWMADNSQSRWDRISNSDEWILLNWKQQALWPLTFEIVNDLSDNQTLFRFYHNNTNEHVIEYYFENAAFVANEPMNIYIFGDSENEKYEIHEIDIQLSYPPIPTSNYPSVIPTILPSLSPHERSSLNIKPTNIPSILPTANPMNKRLSVQPSSSNTTEIEINDGASPPSNTFVYLMHRQYEIYEIVSFVAVISAFCFSFVCCIKYKVCKWGKSSKHSPTTLSRVSSDGDLVESIKHHAVITVMDELVPCKLYKHRYYKKSESSEYTDEINLFSPHSLALASMNNKKGENGYKTRGVSEDIYDNDSNIMTKGIQNDDADDDEDLYDEQPRKQTMDCSKIELQKIEETMR